MRFFEACRRLGELQSGDQVDDLFPDDRAEAAYDPAKASRAMHEVRVQ